MEIKPIRNQQDYEAALRRVESLWDSKDGSPEGDELDMLVTLVEAYEREHFPVDLPDPFPQNGNLGLTPHKQGILFP